MLLCVCMLPAALAVVAATGHAYTHAVAAIPGAVGCLQQCSHGSSLAPTPSTTASPPSSSSAAAAPGAGTATAGDTAGATAAGGGSAAADAPAAAAAPGAPSPLAASAYTLIAKASATLNQLTGYHTIEAVKQSMVAADEHLQQLKRDLRQQKVAYDEALAQQTHIHRWEGVGTDKEG